MLSLRNLLAFLDFPLIITGKLVPHTNILFYFYVLIFLLTLIQPFLNYDPKRWATMASVLMYCSDLVYLSVTQICQLLDRIYIKAQQRTYKNILKDHRSKKNSKSTALILIILAILIMVLLTYLDAITFELQPGWVGWIELLPTSFRCIWFLFVPIKFYLMFSLINNKLCGLISSISFDQKSKLKLYSCFECYNDLFAQFQHVKLLHVFLLFIIWPPTYFAVRMDYIWEYLAWDTITLTIFVALDHLIERSNSLVSTVIADCQGK